MSNIICIGDLHEPFAHRDALPFIEEVAWSFDVDKVIFLGDEVDSHALSRYTTDPDGQRS